MSIQDRVNNYINSINANSRNKFAVYEQAKAWYNRVIGFSDQVSYDQFIRLVCDRVGI